MQRGATPGPATTGTCGVPTSLAFQVTEPDIRRFQQAIGESPCELARRSWRVTGSAVSNQGLCGRGLVREWLDGALQAADRAPASVAMRYQGWLMAEDGREVVLAKGVSCIHATS